MPSNDVGLDPRRTMRKQGPVREPTTRYLAPEPGAASFSIAFGRRPKMVALVRRIVVDFYGALYDEIAPLVEQQRGWTSQVSLAAAELVENTVRHGLDGDAVFSITVAPDPREPRRAHVVRVTTRNRADPAQRELVLRRVNELRTAPDLFAYYLSLLTESTQQGGSAGLGLARIRVEARMDLHCSIDGDELEITASARVGVGVPVLGLPRSGGPERTRSR
jgi:hypothetical protein